MTILNKLWEQLRVRLIIVFAAIAVITYLLSGLSLYRSVDTRLLALRRREVTQRANEIQALLEQSLETGITLEYAAKNIPLVAGNNGIHIFDQNGELIIDYIPFLLQDDLSTVNILGQGELIALPNDVRYLVVSEPLHQQGTIIGEVVVSTSLANINSVIADLNIQLTAALVASLIAIAGAGIFIGSNIARVLGEIETAAQAIAQGEFDQRILVRSQDEVGRLATTVNDMAVQLSILSQSQSQFFSKVSHELRTPLTIVKGFAITILRNDDLDQNTRGQVEIINQQTDSLTRLVDDLLDLVRVDVGQLMLEFESTNLVDIVSEVCEGYQIIFREKDISLKIEHKVDPIKAIADPQRIKQVIRILLDNAIKYLDSGDEVVIGIKTNGEKATIIVADNGPGIPTESLSMVFERFFQVESTQDGMGLGLALAKELVESHEGMITIESGSPTGCCFRITLPKDITMNGRNVSTCSSF